MEKHSSLTMHSQRQRKRIVNSNTLAQLFMVSVKMKNLFPLKACSALSNISESVWAVVQILDNTLLGQIV
jgi:hypothetical protein